MWCFHQIIHNNAVLKRSVMKVVISAHEHTFFFLTFNPVNCIPWSDSCQGRVLITAQISEQHYRTIKPNCLLDCKPMPKHHPAIFDNVQNFFQLKSQTRHTSWQWTQIHGVCTAQEAQTWESRNIWGTMRYTHSANSRSMGRETISKKLCTF